MCIYRFAGLDVRIESVFDAVHRLCQEYRSDGVPRFSVRTAEGDIALERDKAAAADLKAGREVVPWPDDYLETLAIYRKIAERLPDYDALLIHGSCICVDGDGYLFAAKSGTGKSTHARLWRELLGGRAAMVNDDKPMLRMTGNVAVAYGTPWDGKHHLSGNIAAPLKAICFLEQSPENHIREIAPSEALPALLGQVYRPADAAAMARTLNLVDRLAGCVKLYRLGCNMNIEAAQLAYETMRGVTI